MSSFPDYRIDVIYLFSREVKGDEAFATQSTQCH